MAEEEINSLVSEIVNVTKGDSCFLCKVSNGAECIWDEIRGDILDTGHKAMVAYKLETKKKKMYTINQAAQFACY